MFNNKSKTCKSKNLKTGGYLFIASGISFGVSAILADQMPFFGISAAFISIGISYIVKAKKQQP